MSNETNQNLPLGFKLQNTLAEHNGLISRVVWSPDGNKLASSSFDRTIKLWDVDTGKCLQTLSGHTARVREVSWSPNGKFIASGSDDSTIRIWKVETGQLYHKIPMVGVCFTIVWSLDSQMLAAGGMRDDPSILFWSIRDKKRLIPEGLEEHYGQINTLALSSSTLILASGSHDNTIRLWEKETNKLVAKSRGILKGHSSDVLSVTWSPDGQLLASGSYNRTIRIWNPQTGRTIFVLEGHTGSVNCVRFSYDGKLLASKSSDGTVRLWRCDTWETVTVLEEPTHKSLPFGLAFHPNAPILATLGEEDTIIRIWEINQDFLLNSTPTNSCAQYTNAKVVLLGDTGVGKSGLSLVLTGQSFQATESTHGRHVHKFDSQEVELEDSRQEMREVLLWDLAGQPNYRLIHQLHLNELAAVLIVFDARSETEPFAGVHYWNRALRQAQNLPGNSEIPLKKFLVSARTDRGRVSVSRPRIKKLIGDLGFDDYFETSAKEGLNISELTMAICQAIDWDVLPKVISTKLFERIKCFLIEEKQEKRLLSTVGDLYRTFVQSARQVIDETKELQEQFDTCIGRLESRDLIRRLSFGNLILLQPELLDAYTSAIVNAAKDEPEGLGSILEEDVLAGRFRMPIDERIPDKEQEKLLLIATVKELLSREITLRVHTDDVSWLVFPSQLTREWPEAPDPEGKAVIFNFEGPILNVYTTLVVRLSQSGFFHRKDMWKDAVLFTAKVGGECGIWLRQMGEGKAELTIFFNPEASEETRFHFEEYVHTHLKRRALPESINRRRIFVCPNCSTPVSDLQARRRRERGFNWINCGVCENRVSLLDREERVKAIHTSITPQIDRTADIQRQVEAAVSTIQGKIETKEFDVFLAHNSDDKAEVKHIAELLKQHGLNPWLDEEQIPPGGWFQEIIQQAITHVKSVAIFVGPKSLDKWQKLELRVFISQCIEANIPIIPVLLPGVEELPPELPFLHELSYLLFNSIDDSEALDKLVWGITGQNPQGKHQYSEELPTYNTSDKTVLLLYQKQDKELVTELANKLKSDGIQPYLYEDIYQPGQLLREIASIPVVAVCIGDKISEALEEGQLKHLITESVRCGNTVIPVILHNCTTSNPKLPYFLRSLRSVDFREPEPDPMYLLIWAITGVRPQKEQS